MEEKGCLLKRVLVVLGVVFEIVGVLLCAFAILPVPVSTDWYRNSFVVPEYGHFYVRGDFLASNLILKISFGVTEGGPLDFLVMDEMQYMQFNSSLEYNYYEGPSALSVAEFDTSWTIPAYRSIFFVWNNRNSFEPKSVSALFQVEYSHAVLPPLITVLGVLLLFGGLSSMSLAYRFPSPVSSRKRILVGYVFASLGGVVGIIVGAYLMRKENLENKFHGKVMIAIGIAAITMDILLYMIAVQAW